VKEHLAGVRNVLRTALANRQLRRIEFGYALFIAAECAVWLSLLVYAYAHGGPSAASLIAIVQLVPCAVLAPLLGAVSDRRRPGLVLLVGYLLQGTAMGALAGAIFAGAPLWVAFVLAPVVNLAVTVSRPAQAALLPDVVRTPEELTAANVLTGWSEGASTLAAPAVAGVLLAVDGPALAITACAAMAMIAALLVAGVPGPAPAETEGAVMAQLVSNLRMAGSDPTTRVLLTMHAYYYAVFGAVELLCVFLAASVLHLGRGGAGYLTAALGAGLVLAGSATVLLVGRTKLVGIMMTGLLGSALALAVLGARATVVGAFLLIAAVGFGSSVFDVTGRTLLQRVVPSDAVAGVFSVLESLMNVGVAIGIVMVRVATAVGGYRAALVAPALVGTVLAAALWRRLRAIDGAARVPHVEVRLLQRIPIFAPLPAPSIEALARRLLPIEVPAGTVIMHEGDPGDRYFAVADGTVEVSRGGGLLAELGRGDGFGEIALVHNVPRTATVTARTPALLYGLDKEPFVLTLTGHPTVEARAKEVAARNLRSQDADADDSADHGRRPET
jgi:MFS family permease